MLLVELLHGTDLGLTDAIASSSAVRLYRSLARIPRAAILGAANSMIALQHIQGSVA